MSHVRERLVEGGIRKAMSYSPCIGILGMRQVGKSTLLKKFSRRYYTFDQDEFAAQFERRGASLLEIPEYPLALDEIQKYPPAFDALKYSIDRVKKPGRFLISGSIRFASKKQIRESLTGRIVLIELFPLTLSECHSKKQSPFLTFLRQKKKNVFLQRLKNHAWASPAQLKYFLETGGLPGICFKREGAIRSSLFENHLDTLLGRDIHLVRKTSLSVSKLRLILTELAKNQGLPCHPSSLARIVGCSAPTLTAILQALESIFLIRSYGKTYFIEDAGLSYFLSPLGASLTRWDMIRCLYHELRAQLFYQLKNELTMRSYQTRGGIDIPFLLEFKTGEKIAINVDEENIPSDKTLKGLTWLKRKIPNLMPIVLCQTNQATITKTGTLILPWSWIF